MCEQGEKVTQAFRALFTFDPPAPPRGGARRRRLAIVPRRASGCPSTAPSVPHWAVHEGTRMAWAACGVAAGGPRRITGRTVLPEAIRPVRPWAYFTATGLIIEPVPPVITSGGA